MTPYYQDEHMTLYGGDCREVLRELPADSVHTVVTSPPYWGLRDYGVGGQLGLEPTPEEYVANMVAVFREVRRVLRDDGTLWLNLGSTYLASGGERTYGSSDGATGRGPGTRRNRGAAGASGRTPSHPPEHVPACGTDGTAPRGSLGPGSSCSDLCDGCRAVLPSRTTDTLRPQRVSPLRDEPTGRDTAPVGSAPDAPDASPLDAPASTTPRSETPPPGPCSHCGNCGACLAVLRSPSRDAQACARTSACSVGTGSPSEPSAARTSGTVSSGLAWGDYTSTLRPKNLVPIPWMVAMALQADGWILRRDIVWSKPNPMPESVTDRPTSAHEYLFLLSKSPRYYYDAEAVREPSTTTRPELLEFGERQDVGLPEGRTDDRRRIRTKKPDGWATHAGGHGSFHKDGREAGVPGEMRPGRNLRSVWTIATEPYPGAHFATFPRKLVEPCVKAGSRADGVVLDPFAGSGTTLLVAQALGRRAIGIDLNPEYLRQALARNAQAPLGLVG